MNKKIIKNKKFKKILESVLRVFLTVLAISIIFLVGLIWPLIVKLFLAYRRTKLFIWARLLVSTIKVEDNGHKMLTLICIGMFGTHCKEIM
jgi:hypothetical protein